MADTRAAQLRRLWLNVHLWIALSLVASARSHFDFRRITRLARRNRFRNQSEALCGIQGREFRCSRRTISQKQKRRSPTIQRNRARLRLRYPEPGWPVRVVMRAQPREAGARPRPVTVYLDPPTGKVLDVVDFRASLFGFLHVFHENLTIPEYSGRQIVGWAGVGMLILSLTGIWLWWPRGGNFLRGLRWQRSSLFTICHFRQTAREAMSSIAPMTPQGQRGFGQIAQRTALTADQALAAALKAEPNGKPVALFLPVQQRERPLTWRTQISRAGSGDIVTVTTDDPQRTNLTGDSAALGRPRTPGSGGFTKAATADRYGPLS